MHRIISSDEQKEIRAIVQSGYYQHGSIERTHIENLGLALLKYVVFANIKTWRWGYPLLFKELDECGMTRGQRSKATVFLYKMDVIYPRGKRWMCREQELLISKMQQLENKLKATNKI